MIFDVGRICYKIAGRDAGNYCVVIKKIDTNFVEIDGQTRRKKCNIDHLEPLEQTVKIKDGASNKDVAKALSDAGFPTDEKKSKPKKAAERPKKQKGKSNVSNVLGEEVKKPKKESKPAKKEVETEKDSANKPEAKKETKAEAVVKEKPKTKKEENPKTTENK